ncbi:unnamed protein product [Cylindrotheca closterium]|uniref:Uncharacterized protein n=1 Tax=Cylindrotheca closterium TaxID=2856 RepID=A0AAD2JGX2_9STRA|nr:unnamed protein product [Cylindrotheca closterium]
MTKTLLCCDYEDFDTALDLKFKIQEELGFKVMLDVEDWGTTKQAENKNTRCKRNDNLRVSQELKRADVLLVFHFHEFNISAWVILENTDEIQQQHHDKAKKQAERKSYFPECIDFSDSFAEGITIFESILRTDYGLVATQ